MVPPRPFHIITPLIHSMELSKRLGREVLLKLDSLQPSGSFKIRGIGNTIQNALSLGHKNFVGVSGGNAGLAMCYAATRSKANLHLFIPMTTKKIVCDEVQDLYEDVKLHQIGKDLAESKQIAQQFIEDSGEDYFYVDPGAQETSWIGNSTLVHEVADQIKAVSPSRAERPSAFVVAVGGGGLAIGTLMGMEDVGWSDVAILCMETEGADSFAQALSAGKLVTLPGITSIATSLGVSQCIPELFNRAIKEPDRIISSVITDQKALEACLKFSTHHRMLVEPSCGATLAPLYGNGGRIALEGLIRDRPGPVVMEVCGGNMATVPLYESWMRELDVSPKNYDWYW